MRNESTSSRTFQIGAHNESVYSGVQLGLVNTSDFYGVQLGVYNYAMDLEGLQVGPVCATVYSRHDDSYLQLGLLTIRKDAPFYMRVSPLVGWHINKRRK